MVPVQVEGIVVVSPPVLVSSEVVSSEVVSSEVVSSEVVSSEVVSSEVFSSVDDNDDGSVPENRQGLI